jgi:hypothetical protein
MALLPTIKISDQEKLETLRRLDHFRHWHSLEDKRYCLCCGQIISGDQIQLIGGTRPAGPLRLACPTANCDSIPMDWVLPTDEVLSAMTVLAQAESHSDGAAGASNGSRV